MEYVSYILITFGILVVCVFLIRPAARPRPDKVIEAEEPSQLALQRELNTVPTPWGWPGHSESETRSSTVSMGAQEVHGVSESLHKFVDQLFREKHTVDDQEYLLQKNASLRRLVEDRYGRASTMQEIRYKKVKPPHLRDPNAPHDQMDNFPSGKLDQIVSRIPEQSQNGATLTEKARLRKSTELKEIRRPWGW